MIKKTLSSIIAVIAIVHSYVVFITVAININARKFYYKMQFEGTCDYQHFILNEHVQPIFEMVKDRKEMSLNSAEEGLRCSTNVRKSLVCPGEV